MARKSKKYDTIAEALRAATKSVARKKRAREKLDAEIAARVPCEGYEPCIVSFIDVLGFRDLLNTRHAFDIRDVLNKLRHFTAPVKELPARPVKNVRQVSRAFADSVSDAIVRVRVYDTQYKDGAFYHELLDLLHAQVSCVGEGVVIRGGVTVGDAHVGVRGKGPVFGPAMVRAYEIENNEAVSPRIVIDDNAYQSFLNDARLRNQDHHLTEERSYVDRLLRIDEDQKRFIDYLAASESEFDDLASYFLFLESHAKLVREKLAVTTGKVREKFEWLATYHNSVVQDVLDGYAAGGRSAKAFEADFGVDPVSFLEEQVI